MGQDIQQPWLEKNGELLADERLELTCPSWTPETWEAYLTYLEPPLKEKVGVKRERTDRRSIPHPYSVEEEEHFGDPRHFWVRQGVANLPPAEERVIRRFYWDGLSEYTIAHRLKVTRSTVQTLRRRAIARLHKFLSSILPIDERSNPRRKRTHSSKAIPNLQSIC